MEVSCGIQSAASLVFVQFKSDFLNESVWDLVSSCSSSEWMFRKCLTNFSKHVLADMRVVLSYGKFLLL